MANHSKIGASTCERWWNCPGSVAAVAAAPSQPVSPYAREGTAAHKLAEMCLRNGSNAADHLGELLEEPFEVTEEMAEAVQVYLDTIHNDMEYYGVHLSDLNIEHKFHLLNIDPDAFGTNDASMTVFLTKVIVYDYKHGKGVAVDAEDNKQGMFYALGAIEGQEVDEVEIVIVQPRAAHRDGPVRRWSITKDELITFGYEMQGRINETKVVDAPVVAGPWCHKTFCPAMATCPAVRKSAERDAMVVFDQPIELKRPEDISPLALRRLLDGIPLLDAWIKSVMAYAEQKANNGEEILGYKLVRGRDGNRKWIDADQAAVELLAISGAVYELPKLKSPAMVEKLLGKSNKKLIDSLTTRSEGKPILVPEDDPREAVSPQATMVFKEPETFEQLL